MKKGLIVFLLCLLTLPAWPSSSLASVSYGEYLDQVLAYYPLLKKEEASVEKAIASKALVATAHLPHFWASIGSEYGNDPVYVFGTLLRQNRFSNADFQLDRLNTPKSRRDHVLSAGGEWMLFDFFQTTGKIKAAGLIKESAFYQQEFTRMEAILAASEIYERLDTTDQWLTMLTEQAHEAESNIASMENLEKKGLVLGADFFLARMRLSDLIELKNEVLSQRAALEMVFNILRGENPLTPVIVVPLTQAAVQGQSKVDEYIAESVAGRLDIKSMSKLLEAGKVSVDTEKKSIAPKIVVDGNVEQHGKTLTKETGESYIVGLKAKFDIDPGYGSRVKLAKAQAKQLEAELEQAKDQAAKDTAEAYYRLEAIQNNVRPVEQKLSDSREALKLLIPLYQEGQRSIVEIITARMAQVASYERYLKVQSLKRLTTLDLQFLTGSLTISSAKELYGE